MFKWVVDEEIEMRLLEPRHAQQWFDLVQQDREHMSPWFGWVSEFKTVQDALSFIQVAQGQYAACVAMKCGIWFNGKLIGGVSYQQIDWQNSTASIGYWIVQSYEGNGIVTKCLRALVDYSFRELKLNRVEVRSAVENNRSRAIPQRLGFVEEGRIKQSQRVGEKYLDEIVYSMLAFEWFQRYGK